MQPNPPDCVYHVLTQSCCHGRHAQLLILNCHVTRITSHTLSLGGGGALLREGRRDKMANFVG